MRKLRSVACAAAAAAVAAAAVAAPASAQELPPTTDPPLMLVLIVKAIVGQPPCTPGDTVPEASDCAFDTAVWGLEKGQWGVTTAQGVYNQQYAKFEAAARDAFDKLDAAEKLAVGKACEVAGIPDEDCPEI